MITAVVSIATDHIAAGHADNRLPPLGVATVAPMASRPTGARAIEELVLAGPVGFQLPGSTGGSMRGGGIASPGCIPMAWLWLLVPPPLAAHTVSAPPTPDEVWTLWSFAPSVTLPLAVASGLYVVGLWRLWSRAGAGRGISFAQAAAYGGGIVTLVIALMSPLDAAGAALFSLHMVQHLLLILVAAPLLVVGAPEMALLWALPARWRGGFGRFTRRVGGALNSEGDSPAGPLLVTVVATGVLWMWHIPALYDLAVRNEAVHYAEHVAFLVTALLFWATVLRLRPRDHAGNGLRILYVFATAVQGSILGALITLAAKPLYASHADIPEQWGIAPLADQQLAGLIMWVPPALLYLGVVAYLFIKWLQALEARRTRQRDPGVTAPVDSMLPPRHL